MKPNRYTLRVLARLLNYPDAAVRADLLPMLQVLDGEAALGTEWRAELHALVADLNRLDPLEAEGRYVETFDRGRATSLHLFEHVHGDSRDRGPAMIDLQQTYVQAGLQLDAAELPDHLCVVLEFASTQPPQLARDFLAEMVPILNSIFSALLKRRSPYAAVLAAVLELAGEKPKAVPVPTEVPLDDSWAEPEAFAGCSTHGQSKPAEQPIHFVRQPRAGQGAVA